MENMKKPMIEIDGELIEIDSAHDEKWLEDENVPDSEKLAYFESLDMKPVKNLATEFGITSQEQYEEFLRNLGTNQHSNPSN